jgi:hypothetical protein
MEPRTPCELPRRGRALYVALSAALLLALAVSALPGCSGRRVIDRALDGPPASARPAPGDVGPRPAPGKKVNDFHDPKNWRPGIVHPDGTFEPFPQSTPDDAPAPVTPEQRKAQAEEGLSRFGWFLGWLARLSALAAALTLVASFIFPVIPRAAAVACAAVAAGAALGQYALLAYGASVAKWAVVLAVLSAVAVAVPWVIAGVRWGLRRSGLDLIREGDVRPGVALAAAGDPRINEERKAVADALQREQDGQDPPGKVRALLDRLGVPPPGAKEAA